MSHSGITDEAARALLSIIVATPSVNPAFQGPDDPADQFGEDKLAQALAEWLEAAGLPATLDEVLPGRPNLITGVEGSGKKRMIWECHLDTVQVTGMAAPFDPVLRDGRLYGRGAVDDGGCIAAFLLALRALAEDPPACSVDVVAAMDEEFAYKGVLHHLNRNEVYDLAIAGEPTDLRVVRACKGCVRWVVTLGGRAAHTSKPDEGLNAIDAARALLAAYDDEMARRTRSHPLLGPATLVCTGIEAGQGPNTVPPVCKVRFDYRYLPHETGAAVHADFAAIALSLPKTMPGLTVDVGAPFVDSSAMDVPETEPIVTQMGAVCASHGIDPVPIGVPFGSDATKLFNNGGIPSIVFGPGSIEQAHALDEHVEIGQVTKAARMLVDLARGL